mmetsp:Transcript_69717/g.130138  ORF Transcript_69717/g.130138 Transcript_69717/m.130138 type:complete len:302 (-) Transcript_69717:102-1007(-)
MVCCLMQDSISSDCWPNIYQVPLLIQLGKKFVPLAIPCKVDQPMGSIFSFSIKLCRWCHNMLPQAFGRQVGFQQGNSFGMPLLLCNLHGGLCMLRSECWIRAKVLHEPCNHIQLTIIGSLMQDGHLSNSRTFVDKGTVPCQKLEELIPRGIPSQTDQRVSHFQHVCLHFAHVVSFPLLARRCHFTSVSAFSWCFVLRRFLGFWLCFRFHLWCSFLLRFRFNGSFTRQFEGRDNSHLLFGCQIHKPINVFVIAKFFIHVVQQLWRQVRNLPPLVAAIAATHHHQGTKAHLPLCDLLLACHAC